jgi:hypothetical protein
MRSNWTRSTLLQELRRGKRTSSLRRAAIRRFGSWARALQAAGISASRRPYRAWTPDNIVRRLLQLKRENQSLVGVDVRRTDEAFYKAAQRTFRRPWRKILQQFGLADLQRRRSVTFRWERAPKTAAFRRIESGHASLSDFRIEKKDRARWTACAGSTPWMTLMARPGRLRLALLAPVKRRDTRRAVQLRVLAALQEMIHRWIPRGARSSGRSSIREGRFTFTNASAGLKLQYDTGKERGLRREFLGCASAWVSLVFETMRTADHLGTADLTQVVDLGKKMVRRRTFRQN